MSIEQTAALLEHARYSAAATAATALVEKHLDLPGVEATWDLGSDELTLPSVRLCLRDAEGTQGSRDLKPWKMDDETYLLPILPSLREGFLHVRRWRRLLNQFYQNVRLWCGNLPEKVEFHTEPMLRNEVLSGYYQVDQLIVTCGQRSFRLLPIAAWVGGADGLVELRGADGIERLLYYETESDWFYVPRKIPFTTIRLTEAFFLELAKGGLDG